MKSALLMTMIISVVCLAGVLSGTYYRSSAQEFYALILSTGYDCDVKIVQSDLGLYNYAVVFTSNFDSSTGIAKFLAAVVATARVSSASTWRSNALIVFFNDYSLLIETSSCRYLQSNYQRMTEQQLRNYIDAQTVSVPTYLLE